MLGISPSEDELYTHTYVCKVDAPYTKEFISSASEWLQRILGANKNKKVYAENALEDVCAHFWYGLLVRSLKLNSIYTLYKKSEISAHLGLRHNIMFHLKLMLSKLGII